MSAIMALNMQEPIPSDIRRRSVDTTTTGHLSPSQVGTAHQRRVSLDQTRPMRHPDRKARRDSDASNPETLVSGPSSYSTLVNPMTLAGNDSRTHLDMAPVEESEEKFQVESSSMVESFSQPSPSTISGAMRRVSSASESRVWQSFDLRMFASSHGQDMAEAEEEEDDGWHRRHSMHEPFGGRASQDETSFFSRSTGLMSSISVSSFQEPPPRQRTKGGKHRTSFSGSATISGRFSRFWSNGAGKDTQEESFHGKDGSAGSMGSLGRGIGSGGLSVDELTKIDREATALGLISKEAGATRSRVGMMNRLSGIWPRRSTGPERVAA
ncbi:hypothetical protein EDD21DRAFT_122977 [Dissophora ornata]|nr:hypothetical protein EDD21DRAFT_122977 [Dissophora ornata]